MAELVQTPLLSLDGKLFEVTLPELNRDTMVRSGPKVHQWIEVTYTARFLLIVPCPDRDIGNIMASNQPGLRGVEPPIHLHNS